MKTHTPEELIERTKATLVEPHRFLTALRTAAVLGIINGLVSGELLVGIGTGVFVGVADYVLRPIAVNIRIAQLNNKINNKR
jgi:hypothetical protein